MFLEDLYARKKPIPIPSEWQTPSLGRLSTDSVIDRPYRYTQLPLSIAKSERKFIKKPRPNILRRRSAATTSSGESQTASDQTSSDSRRSSLMEMAVIEGDGLKSKFMSSFHANRKFSSHKSDVSLKLDSKKHKQHQAKHQRGFSVDCKTVHIPLVLLPC